MSTHLINAKDEFWIAYAIVRASLEKLPRQKLADLQHEAEAQIRAMQTPFSDRAAAQMVHAATVELLG